MATAQNVIDRAGGLLRIRDGAGDAVDSTTSSDMLDYLSDMIYEWAENGILDIPGPSAVGDTLDVSPGTLRAIIYNLAADYGETIGKTLSNRAQTIAENTKQRLIAKSTVSMEISIRDGGLTSSYGRYNVRTDA